MRFAAITSALMLLAQPAFGVELRIARYDASRVSEQYQHTKEIQDALSVKRHTRVPDSVFSDFDQRTKLEDHLAELSDKVKLTVLGTPDRERLEQQEQLAKFELEVVELRRTLETRQRDEDALEETRRTRGKLIEEIMAEARLLASEGGYALIVADNTPADGFPSVTITFRGEDVTDELLKRLNQKFRAAR